jgi:hypothetical protein
VRVERLLQVDLQEQTFQATVRVEATWTEAKLKKLSSQTPMPGQVQRIHFSAERTDQERGHLVVGSALEDEATYGTYWTPRLYFQNLIAKENDEQWFNLFDAAPNDARNPPIVRLSWKLTGTFQEPLELQLFPLDQQLLTMRLVSSRENTPTQIATTVVNELDGVVAQDMEAAPPAITDSNLTLTRTPNVVLVKNQSSAYRSTINTSTFLQQHEYFLFAHLNFETGFTPAHESSSAHQYPYLDVQLQVKRFPWNWVFNVVIPLCASPSSHAVPDRAHMTVPGGAGAHADRHGL